MEANRIDPTTVKGWGIDADPDNDPTYPMKRRNDGEHDGYTWERPPQQPRTVEVLHSIERPNITATYGTASPPSGLSGMLRRLAFHYSESSYGHWLPLMLADRIDAMEALAEDIGHGHVPNIPAEMGWRAEWEHNNAKFVKQAIVGVVLSAVVFELVRRNKQHRV